MSLSVQPNLSVQKNDWKEYLQQQSKSHHITFAWLIVAIVPLWSLADYMVVPRVFFDFMVVRISGSMIVAFSIYLMKKQMLTLKALGYISNFVLYDILGICMIALEPNEIFYWSISYSTCFIAVALFQTWEPKHHFICIAKTVVIVGLVLVLFRTSPFIAFIANGLPITMTVAAGCIVFFLVRIKLMRDNFDLVSELKNRNKDLTEALTLLQMAQTDLARNENALRSTMSRVFHDIQKPYQQFGLVLHILSRARNFSKIKDDIAKYQPVVTKQIASAERMLADLEDIERELKTNPVNLSLRPILEECILEIFFFTEKTYTFTYDFQHTQKIIADRDKLKRVINNILGNAKNATITTNNIETIEFSTRDEGDFIRLGIKNTGSFVPDDMCNLIFDKFYSMDNHGGRGIGLTIVKKFMELIGGSCWVESSEEENHFAMNLLLPRTLEVDVDQQILPQSSVGLCGTIEVKNAKTNDHEDAIIADYEDLIAAFAVDRKRPLEIVICDDEAIYAEKISTDLKESSKLNEAIIFQYFSSLALLQEEETIAKADLVITDIDFYGQADGIDIIKSVKLKNTSAAIIVHSHHSVPYAVQALQAGADILFLKPMPYRHLLQFICERVLLGAEATP